ncbi:MAG: hypothetical protein ACKPA7_10835, partial [Sphaerospermopsis kisseleviana]
MNFSTTVANLATAVKTAIKAIAKETRHAALTYLHLQSEKDRVVVTGTDLTTFTRVSLPAQVLSPGESLVPAKLTSDIIKILPAGEIEVKLNNDQTLTLSAGKTSSKTISGMDSSEFPVFPEIDPRVESVKSLIVDSHEFIRVFRAISKYAHSD